MIDQKKLKKLIQSGIDKAVNVNISSDVPFSLEQIEVLEDLNEYCVNQVLSDEEVIFDPRKIPYKANQEMHDALTAMCLSQSLVNPNRKTIENKEFFAHNITIQVPEPGKKAINFGRIETAHVLDAVYPEISEDWKIYRDKKGMGIKALIDEKTNLEGLSNYQRGGDPIYEFARFHRKYTEKERAKENRARESAQEAFRNEMAKTLATKITEQQLLEGRNPMELMEMLFSPQRNQKPLQQISGKAREIDPKVEENISLLLEYSNTRDDNGRER